MPSSLDHRQRSLLGLTAFDRSVAAMVLVIKVIVLLFGALAFQVYNGERVRTLTQLLAIWNRWDGGQYQMIAQKGYAAVGDQRLALAFFPLYPWLTRMTAVIVHDMMLSAFLVSTIASVALGVAMARLFAIDYSRHLARRAVWFMFIFPTSYFLHIGYSESLFLALVATSFLAARRERWMAAGILGALAVLTHDNGILLVPALGADAAWELWKTRRFNRRWLWIAVVPLGLAVYMLVNYEVTGDPLAFLLMEREHWSNTLTAPWRGIAVSLGVASYQDASQAAMVGTQVVFFLAISLAGTIAAAFLLRPAYAVWMALNWLLFASQSWDISAPRLVLAMLPLFILFAQLARRRLWDAAITVWSLLWLGLFVSEFVCNRWAY